MPINCIYIIEHLESTLYPWCLIEYKYISRLVGRKKVWFSNVRKGSKELQKYGKVLKPSITTLPLKNVCVLDPKAKKTLTPLEAKKFDYFVFGGILGDYPPQQRTKKELTTRFTYPIQTRNIGRKQMSTDNAVAVVQEIVKGKHVQELPFQDGIEVALKLGESIRFPFRYLMRDRKPLLSKELVDYLKRKRGL